MQEDDNSSPYLNSVEAAKRLKLSVHTLNKWRHLGKGLEKQVTIHIFH